MPRSPVKAAIWARVNADHQTEANQVPGRERRFSRHHRYHVRKRYRFSDVSAFDCGPKDALRAMLDDTWQEPWPNGSDATTELLATIAAWVANLDSARRSERIKAGLARRWAEGKPVGGQKNGAKDKRMRETVGYSRAWERRRGAA